MSGEEVIAGYLDRSLGAEEARLFEARMAGDPVLAAKVEAYRANDQLLRRGLDDLGLVPDRLIAAVNDHPALRGASSATLVDLDHERARRSGAASVTPRWFIPPWAAVAASVLIGLGIANRLITPSPTPLEVALSTTPSGATVRLVGNETFTPTLTVPTRDGRYCREYRLTGPKTQRDGLACGAQSHWTVERIEPGAAIDASGYQEAGGPEHRSFDDVYRRLNVGDPLSVIDERAAIARGWRPAK